MNDRYAHANADVCLVLEGAHPVVGGVSVWLDELVRNLPDVRFALATLDASGALPVCGDGACAVELDPEREDVPRALAGELPDAALYHACMTGAAGEAAAHAARERGRPLLVTEHGLAWREAGWTIG